MPSPRPHPPVGLDRRRVVPVRSLRDDAQRLQRFLHLGRTRRPPRVRRRLGHRSPAGPHDVGLLHAGIDLAAHPVQLFRDALHPPDEVVQPGEVYAQPTHAGLAPTATRTASSVLEYDAADAPTSAAVSSNAASTIRTPSTHCSHGRRNAAAAGPCHPAPNSASASARSRSTAACACPARVATNASRVCRSFGDTAKL